MSLTQSTRNVETANTLQPARTSRLRKLLTTWELYPIILLAGFLRFYQINVTEFDDDQVAIFRMAYNAVHNGLIPVMSNGASIGIAHPPGVIFLYMLPALFSANPLGGALLVAFLTLLAVILNLFLYPPLLWQICWHGRCPVVWHRCRTGTLCALYLAAQCYVSIHRTLLFCAVLGCR